MYTQEQLQKELDARWPGRLVLKFSEKEKHYELWEKRDGREFLLTPIVNKNGGAMALSDLVVGMVHKYAAMHDRAGNARRFARNLIDPVKAYEEARSKAVSDTISDFMSQEVKPGLRWMTGRGPKATVGGHGTGHLERQRAWGKMGRNWRRLKK